MTHQLHPRYWSLWNFQFPTSSKELIYLPCWGILRSTVEFPHKGQWRDPLMFSLICAWTNGWANNQDADYLRRHCTHYDVIAMTKWPLDPLLSSPRYWLSIFFYSAFLMMTSSNGSIFRVTGHLCGESTGPRCIPRTKASDAELWCFLWSASE